MITTVPCMAGKVKPRAAKRIIHIMREKRACQLCGLISILCCPEIHRLLSTEIPSAWVSPLGDPLNKYSYAVPTPSHRAPNTRERWPHPSPKGELGLLWPGIVSSSATQAHIQGLWLVHHNIYLIYVLLDHMKELVLCYYNHKISMSWWGYRISEESQWRPSEDGVPETGGLGPDQLEHLLVTLIGQKGTLWDTPQLPMPLGGMKKCWRGRKDRGMKIFWHF